MDNKVLITLDLVVASIHSYFNLSREKQTKRLIKAISNPVVNILSHPFNRKINDRSAINFDFKKVLTTAKDNKVALEINSHPTRLDLDDLHAKQAHDHGVKLAISTDAHSKKGLDSIKYGLYQARRGWVEASDVINTYPIEKLNKFLNKS